mgnify:CR=1 FL=1
MQKQNGSPTKDSNHARFSHFPKYTYLCLLWLCPVPVFYPFYIHTRHIMACCSLGYGTSISPVVNLLCLTPSLGPIRTSTLTTFCSPFFEYMLTLIPYMPTLHVSNFAFVMVHSMLELSTFRSFFILVSSFEFDDPIITRGTPFDFA